MLPIDKIESVVTRVQIVYLIIACLAIFACFLNLLVLLWAFVVSIEEYDREVIFELLYISLMHLVLFFGLLRRKPWALPLILIVAAFGFFSVLILILFPAISLGPFLLKFVAVPLLFFYGYQIHFFSKPEVKQYFENKGTILF